MTLYRPSLIVKGETCSFFKKFKSAVLCMIMDSFPNDYAISQIEAKAIYNEAHQYPTHCKTIQNSGKIYGILDVKIWIFKQR